MTRSRRVKPEVNMQKMNDLVEVNEAMKTIRDLKAQIKRFELQAEEKVSQIKQRLSKQLKPLLQKIEPLENGILAFAEYDKDELFKKKKTIDLVFGLIGFRKSTKISIKKTTLGLLKKLKLKSAIKIKETVNKEAMKDFTDAMLKKVDAERTSEDNFWYEVKEIEVSKEMKNEQAR